MSDDGPTHEQIITLRVERERAVELLWRVMAKKKRSEAWLCEQDILTFLEELDG